MPLRLLRSATIASLALALAAASAAAQDTSSRSHRSNGSSSDPTSATSPSKSTKKRKHHKSTSTAARPAKPALPEPEWPVKNAPEPLPGSILPAKRIVAFYGNPLSKRMGVLGEYPTDQMLAKLDHEVARWEAADSTHPVQPALHLIVSVAQGSPGKDGKYRQRSNPALIEKVYGWAQKAHAILFLDVQVGQSTLQEELPVLEPFLKRPDVHLGIDPEFSMHHAADGHVPGSRIGVFDAADVNYASSYLAGLVTRYNLPPKILVVHRFRQGMLTNYKDIKLDPKVQIVVNMDGWGPPSLKRESYRRYVYQYPVEYTGFKLFYHNDTKGGVAMMTPHAVLALKPEPLYIQYQ